MGVGFFIGEKILNNIKKYEGFRGLPYKDTLGNLTIGYGTLLPLSEEEGELLLKHRLKKVEWEFLKRYPSYKKLKTNYQQLLANMGYQLGVSGVLKFKKMLTAVEDGDDLNIVKEMKNSIWYKQTPNRVDSLIKEYIL